MSRFKIGVMVDSLRLPIPEGVRKARELGADGIQVYVVDGDMSAEALDASRRRGSANWSATLPGNLRPMRRPGRLASDRAETKSRSAVQSNCRRLST